MGNRPEASDVTVTFLDGEVKTYRISAGPTVGTHLAREAGTTGVLVLFNDTTSVGIPMTSIREWVLNPVFQPKKAGEK